MSYEIGGGTTFKLINSYREWRNDQLDGDVIFTPAQIASRVNKFTSNSQNHELQFISPERQWLERHARYGRAVFITSKKTTSSANSST